MVLYIEMMNKVIPIRRRYCVCGRPCGGDSAATSTKSESTIHGASDETTFSAPGAAPAEKSAPQKLHSESPRMTTTSPSDALTLLQLKVRALEKYKSNYELLCSQLAELNTQVGLQLQRHEVDVSTLHTTVQTLQTANATLQQDLTQTKEELHTVKAMADKDREYASGVHRQLTHVSELLKTSEKKMNEQEKLHHEELRKLQQELRSTQEVHAKNDQIREAVESELTSLKAQMARHGDDDKLRRKYRAEAKALRQEIQDLYDELEQQRSSTRQTKKQLKQTRDERDAVAKQLASVRSDGTHLSEIIDSLREEITRQEKKAQRWKRLHQDTDVRLSESMKAVADLEAQLVHAQETLVAKNTKFEQLLCLLREKTKANEAIQCDLDTAQHRVHTLESDLESHRKQIAVSVKLEEDDVRRYRHELEHMKHLLSLNHQQSSQSSNDMQVLKHELGTLQQLLRKCQSTQQRRRRRNASEDNDSEEERQWRMQVEKAVLQSAINGQVDRALASAS